MTTEEMRNEFYALFKIMANSNKVEYMHIFGQVLKEMMEWMIDYKPDVAQEWIEKLEAIKWKNYLTPKEADKIVANMQPKAPWSREQWKAAMAQYGLPLGKETYYNKCALYVTMNMIMSDSSETLAKYVEGDKLFRIVHELAVDKLIDKDGVFNIRSYFGL